MCLSFFHFNPINAIRQSRGSKVEYSHDGLKSISVKFRGHRVHFSGSAMPGLSLLSLKQNNKNERTSYLLSCITHPYHWILVVFVLKYSDTLEIICGRGWIIPGVKWCHFFVISSFLLNHVYIAHMLKF